MTRLIVPILLAATICGSALAMRQSPYTALPDPTMTPGAVIATATAEDVCRPGWARSVREQRDRETWYLVKREIMRAYGYGDRRSSEYELDHLVALEVGGSNDWRNLWPQPIAEARRKDKEENLMHDAVCAGTVSLRAAQRYFIEGDWAK